MGNLTPVATTRDACDKKNADRFAGTDGDVLVPADCSKLVELPAATKELIWLLCRYLCALREPRTVRYGNL